MSCPLALGIAAAIRVGHNLGAGETAAARRVAMLAIGLTLAFMSSLALVKVGVSPTLHVGIFSSIDLLAPLHCFSPSSSGERLRRGGEGI